MDTDLKKKFLRLWKKYFAGAELPIAFYYSDDESGGDLRKPPRGHCCFIADLSAVREGKPTRFGIDSLGCGGAERYLGFADSLRPNFEYFLSCGIPGEMEGERYKKSPEIVRAMMRSQAALRAPAKFIVFKRWDLLEERDEPEVVIFFAPPDVLSGLFTLASFDEVDPNGVIAPFSAGCGSIVQHPYLEQRSARPRCVLGMFDVSARPCVAGGILTFAAPMKKLTRMVGDMEESFLITPSWEKVRKRIRKETGV